MRRIRLKKVERDYLLVGINRFYHTTQYSTITLSVNEHCGNRVCVSWDSEYLSSVTHLPSLHRREEASGKGKRVQENDRR